MGERSERVEHVAADDGCALWTVRSGAGPGDARHGFVLCHGGPGFWDTLGPIARMLEDLGPVVRWDQRGGGRSQWRPPYTMDRFLADLDQVRRHHGFDQATVVGHSFGATLALRYALDPAYAARVRKLVYVAGVGLGWSWRDEHTARARMAGQPYAARTAHLRAVAQRTPAQERELHLLRLSGEFPDRDRALELAATQVVEVFADDGVNAPITAELQSWPEADLVERCRALRIPTLILDGARDLRPRWSVDSLAESLPDCTRLELAESGHFPWIDEPDAFEAALRRFAA
jgi:proline iminopeptidase